MEDILTALEKVPESVVEGLWNGDMIDTDREHLNMIAHSVSLNDLEELVSWFRQRKTKDIIEEREASLRSLVVLLLFLGEWWRALLCCCANCRNKQVNGIEKITKRQCGCRYFAYSQ